MKRKKNQEFAGKAAAIIVANRTNSAAVITW